MTDQAQALPGALAAQSLYFTCIKCQTSCSRSPEMCLCGYVCKQTSDIIHICKKCQSQTSCDDCGAYDCGADKSEHKKHLCLKCSAKYCVNVLRAHPCKAKFCNDCRQSFNTYRAESHIIIHGETLYGISDFDLINLLQHVSDFYRHKYREQKMKRKMNHKSLSHKILFEYKLLGHDLTFWENQYSKEKSSE